MPAGGHLAARLKWLRDPGRAELIRHGLRGVEKESLRVDARRHTVAATASAERSERR